MNRFLKLLLIFSLTWAIPGNAEFSYSAMKESVSDWYKSYDVKTLPKDLALTYLALASVTIAHEMGHALAAKVLWNSASTIQIGSRRRDPDPKKPLLKFSRFIVTGLNPSFGVCFQDQWHKTKLQSILSSLAGPLMGAASSFFLYKKMVSIDPKLNKYPALILCCLGNSVGQLLANLIPIKGMDNDGWHIVEALRGER